MCAPQTNIFRLAINEIMMRKVRFFLSALIIGLSFLGIGYYYMFSNESNYHRYECDNALTKGIDGTGAMQVFGDYEDQRKLKKEAMDSGVIEYIGTWLPLSSSNQLPEDLINQRQVNGFSPSRHTIWYYIDRSVLGAHNLEFAQSEEVSEEKWMEPEWNGVYLGYNYHGITVGSIYEFTIFDGTTLKCEVLGILEKGSQIVSNLVMSDGRGNGIYTMEYLDDAIIMPEQLYISDRPKGACNWAYTPADGVSMKEARSFLEEKAKELGLMVEIAYLSDGFLAEEIEQRDVRRIDQEACVMLCVICLLVCACLQFMQVMEERKKLGILYANGFSTMDIIWMFTWQSIIQIIVAMMAAWLGLKKLGEGFFNMPTVQTNVIKAVNHWIGTMALPKMICFGIIVFVICVSIPFLMVKGKCPAELIKDNRG